MEIGIDSFAASVDYDIGNQAQSNARAIEELIERIVFADQMGLHVFGIGEHHRKEFLDSAAPLILAAAASKTEQIKLTSSVTVLSAADPVRVYQQFSTLDLISKGRAEIVVGRGSFTEAFPLFGYNLNDYDSIFEEKLDLLLNIRDQEVINWSGIHRPPLRNQEVFPKPYQNKIPIWLGVGGTPNSFVRAGHLGLPLMMAVIGDKTHQYAPFTKLYKQSLKRAGFQPEDKPIGLHSFGYVAKTNADAHKIFFPGYQKVMNKIGKERNWPPMTKDRFAKQADEKGSIVIGDPNTVAQKLKNHSDALGGISRFTFMMDANLSHQDYMDCIALIGQKVIPLVKDL